MSFVHLHCHSHYSLLDGAIQIPDLVERCLGMGMEAVALTDNGTMFGTVEFYLAAKSKGLKPIIGCEMYLTPDISKKERSHNRLILLCQSYAGYQNLIQLVTISHLKGFYYKPRIDIEHLAKFSQELIAISPGMRGPVAQELRGNRLQEAESISQTFRDIYPDRFFLGLVAIGQPMEAIVSQQTIALSQKINLPLVATNDVYYPTRETSFLRDILVSIQMGKKIEDDFKIRDQPHEMFLKSPAEMQALFKETPEAIENTLVIAKLCNVTFETEQVKLPRFDCPEQKTTVEYLKDLVWQGVRSKYPDLTPELQQRVDFELDIITRMNYAPYFLIIHDFLAAAREKGIPIGPGRGSAAGSIVAYALGITQVDPIRYHLLFERFLNPERVSMPDIDLDFCIRRRSEVIDYIVQKYGEDHVSQIVTFGTMNARGVVRDVGRVLNVPLTDVDRVAKLIPGTPGGHTTIAEALSEVPDLKKLHDQDPKIKQVLEIGQKLEGFARHSSTHAAGIVISRDPLTQMVPLMTNDGQTQTQYPMGDLEKIGLLKMDILGLRNLTVLNDTVRLISENSGETLHLSTIPLDDRKTYDLLSEGETMGIFQLESRGMRALIKDLQPQVFEDIIALLALYRPGPLGSGMVSEFISNKSGKTTVKYELPELEPILNETYGLIVYQEQVMQIASVVAGFSLGQSDMMRRAMGKKKKEEMDKLRDDFLLGAQHKSISLEKAGRIFDLCYKFAEYGFNKSHSAAYALISYQTAYLKANYAKPYLTALLSSVLGSADKTALYIRECKRLGLDVSPPAINHSFADFTLTDTGILFGLKAIKNVGEGAIASIVQNREEKGPYTSLSDFCSRVDLKQVNKRVVESLIKSGTFDLLEDRGKLIATYEMCVEMAQIRARERDNGQLGLFGDQDESLPIQTSASNLKPIYLPKAEKLKLEKEMLGLYISGHPLDPIARLLERRPHRSDTLCSDDDGKEVRLGGILVRCRKLVSRNKREMLLGVLEDLTGEIPVIAFLRESFEKYVPFFQEDNAVYLRGRVRVNQDEISLMCDHIEPIDCSNSQSIHLDLDERDEPALLQKISEALLAFPGEIPVYLHYQNKTILVHQKYWAKEDALLLGQLQGLVGQTHLWTSLNT